MDDPAFVWQQQEAREARPMPPASGTTRRREPDVTGSIRWVTLHEAEEVTGVPASTVRNWARKERVPTRFELSTDGQVRLVGLDEVVARARHLGRLRPKPASGPAQPDPTPDQPVPDAPEGSVLVPVDAWNRMISQLGNLHEAGQQLAEARERAAKAETEATFLRERLAELRRQVNERPPAPVAEPEPVSDSQPTDPPEVEPAWLYLYRRWENRSRRRGQ